jgi:hypothetical protein
MFKIKTLTNTEAQEILDICEGSGKCWVKEILAEPEYDKDGGVRITFSGNLAVGIAYGRSDDLNNDSYLLRFGEPKVEEWLKTHCFETGET